MPDLVRRRLRGDAGMTLLEMLITISILSVVMAIFIPMLASVQNAFQKQSDRSGNNDQARLAVEEIDREIRSGNVLYDPALENDPANSVYPGMSLRVYTQTNASTRTPGNQCVQWRVDSGALEKRSWSITWQSDGIVSDWREIADHIVNQPNPPTPPTTPLFKIDPDPAKGGRTIVVTLQENQNPVSG